MTLGHGHLAVLVKGLMKPEVQLVFPWSDSDDEKEGDWRLAGSAAAFFLHHAIASLDVAVRQKLPGA